MKTRFIFNTFCVFCLLSIFVVNTIQALENTTSTLPTNIPMTDLSFDEYVEAANEITTQFSKERISSSSIPVTITFNKKMSFDEIAVILTEYNLKGNGIEARALMRDMTRVTLFSTLDNGIIDAQENIMNMVQHNKCQEYLGIISLQAYTSPSNLSLLQSHKNVFLVDSSNGSLLSQKGITYNNQEEKTDFFPKSLAWELEDLKIID